MKRSRTVLVIFIALASSVFGYPHLTGYSGAPGSGGTCASSCHGNPGGTIQVNGFPDEYVPMRTYTITISHPEGSPISQFNGSCRIGDGSENAGIISDGLNTATYNTAGETNGIHFSAQNHDGGTFEWIMREQGSGEVKLYIAGLQRGFAGSNSTLIYTSSEMALDYIWGDADGSASVNILDVAFLIKYLYKDGPPPEPVEAGDTDWNGAINILDVSLIINYLYKDEDGEKGVYYVRDSTGANPGSDGNSGLSWNNAWASLNHVNSNISASDTVYFGTGRYRGYIDPVSGTDENHRTCYACSAFTEGIAEIWASDSVTGWTDTAVGANTIYKAPFTQTDNIVYDECWTVGQIGGGVDSLLSHERSASDIDRPGEFSYDKVNDMLYVWPVGSGNPNNYDMEASMRPAVWFNKGQDYVTIWGFKMRYGQVGVIYFSGHCGADYNHIEHCNLSGVACTTGTNIGCIESQTCGDDPTFHHKFAEIRACTLANAASFHGGQDTHTYGWGSFSFSHTVIESNYVDGTWGFEPAIGFLLKGGGVGNVIRYNVVNDVPYMGIGIAAAHRDDSIYGNIIIGGKYGIFVNHPTWGYRPFCGNNTVYNSSVWAMNIYFQDFISNDPGTVRYNIFQRGQGNQFDMRLDTTGWKIDSNMYCGGGLFNIESEGILDWSEWSAIFDLNGSYGVDPGFDSVGAVNPWIGFRRSQAPQEMNVTYGGRTWTIFGAVQPSASGSPSGETETEQK